MLNFCPIFAANLLSDEMTQTYSLSFNELLTPFLNPRWRLLFFILICCTIKLPLLAQTVQAVNHINQLKHGKLIVVIPTNKRKLEALLELREQTDLRPRAQDRIQRLIEQSTVERDSFELAVKNAFEHVYNFSKVEFLTDRDLTSFLQAQSVADSHQGTFFLDHRTTENGASAFVFSDHNRTLLERPFPYYARTGRVSSLFDAFFGAREFYWRDLMKVISQLNERLVRFYNKNH